MKAVIGNLKHFFERFKKANSTVQVGILGLTTNIPLFETNIIQPVRKRINLNDKKTPFVEQNINKLINFYYEYKKNKEFRFSSAPYADTIPLKENHKGFLYGVDINKLKIKTINAKYKPPLELQKHYDEAISLFKKLGKIRQNQNFEWENNNCIKITEWNMDKQIITIQPATYFDQIGTNLTVDWASTFIDENNPSATIRNNIEGHEDGKLPKLKTSILANTLGVSVVLVNKITKDVLIPIRGVEQAIMTNGVGQFHCSASGVFELDNFPSNGEILKFDIFLNGMHKEIQEEIGLTKKFYELIPLAFSRELVRGGKPQLFFIAETELDIKDIKSKMSQATDTWEFIDEKSLSDNSELKKYINSPLEAPKNLFTYEGWMSLKIALAYLYDEEPPFMIC
jgi:hypothetical protein